MIDNHLYFIYIAGPFSTFPQFSSNLFPNLNVTYLLPTLNIEEEGVIYRGFSRVDLGGKMDEEKGRI